MASLISDSVSVKALHSNWVVQKFGGTSVGKFAFNIIEQVVLYVSLVLCWQINPSHRNLTKWQKIPRKTETNEILFYRPSLVDNRVAVVCSARSSSTKAEGTTNR